MGFITPYHVNDEFFPQTDDILIKTYNSQSFDIEIITFYREIFYSCRKYNKKLQAISNYS